MGIFTETLRSSESLQKCSEDFNRIEIQSRRRTVLSVYLNYYENDESADKSLINLC